MPVSPSEIEQHLQIALDEIGEIQPWWSDDDQLYIFEHPAYFVVYSGTKTAEEAKTEYIRILRRFIEDRLTGELSPVAEKLTSGRGGKRMGAGRPRLQTAAKTKHVRVPEDIVARVKTLPGGWDSVRQLLAG